MMEREYIKYRNSKEQKPLFKVIPGDNQQRDSKEKLCSLK